MTTTPASSGALKAFLLIAIALGVMATLLAFAFINNNGGGGSNRPGRDIVVAARELALNTQLDPARDFKIVKVPDSPDFQTLAQLTLDARAKESFKGQRVNRPIPAGQPIFLGDIAAYAVFELHEPYVALPILAEPGIAIPGDYVKVLISRPDMTAAAAGSDPGRSSYVSAYAAKGAILRVIAIAGNLRVSRQAVMSSDMGSGGGSGGSAPKIVTLQVTEDQGRELSAALGGGMQKATLVICPDPPGAATQNR